VTLAGDARELISSGIIQPLYCHGVLLLPHEVVVVGSNDKIPVVKRVLDELVQLHLVSGAVLGPQLRAEACETGIWRLVKVIEDPGTRAR